MPFRHAIILQVIGKPGAMPLGLCPLFVPESRDFLGVYPLAENLRLPAGATELRAEAQVAVFAELEYDAAGHILEVKLGSKGGTGTIAKVTSSAATLTPDASLTDEFGNAFPAFTTAPTAEF